MEVEPNFKNRVRGLRAGLGKHIDSDRFIDS